MGSCVNSITFMYKIVISISLVNVERNCVIYATYYIRLGVFIGLVIVTGMAYSSVA